MPPDAAVHDQVQLAFNGVRECPHLKHAAVQEAHVRHGPLILLRVVVEVPAAKGGSCARNHDLVRRGGAAATVGRIYGFSIHHDLAAVRDRHRGVSARIVRKRQRPTVQGRPRAIDVELRLAPLRPAVVPPNAHVERGGTCREVFSGVGVQLRAVDDTHGRLWLLARVRRVAVGRAHVDAAGRVGDAIAEDENARRLFPGRRAALPDGEIDVRAGKAVGAIGRIDHHRAVGNGERRVAGRGRAIRREVRQRVVDAGVLRRTAAERERLRECERPLAVLDPAACRLLHVARHREVVVDLPHDGGGVHGGLVRPRRRPHAPRRARVAERAALLHERPRAQLAKPCLGMGRLRHHERARAERGAARVRVAGIEAHRAARRARVDRKRILACHECERVRNGARRRIDRHGLREHHARHGHSGHHAHSLPIHCLFSSLKANHPASDCFDDTIIPPPRTSENAASGR